MFNYADMYNGLSHEIFHIQDESRKPWQTSIDRERLNQEAPLMNRSNTRREHRIRGRYKGHIVEYASPLRNLSKTPTPQDKSKSETRSCVGSHVADNGI